MGARLAFELAHRVRESGIRKPEYMFMSGCGAPSFAPVRQPYHLLSQEDFKREVAELGGIPPEILNHPDLFNYYVPIIRSEFRNLETYTPRPAYVHLDTDFILLHGDKDKIPLKAIEAWCNYTSRSCQIEVFSGGHFFINDYAEQLTELMKSILSKQRE